MMSNQDNLELWNQFCHVDMSFTKEAKKGAHKFTSVSPMYQKREATRVLGPHGIAWGEIPETEKFTQTVIGETILLSYTAVMFYIFNGQRGEIGIAATEKLAYRTQGVNGYLKVDDEADKKAKTAALTKGLSEIGVSADIHMNLHNNPEYMEIVGAKQRLESAEDLEEQRKIEGERFAEWLNKELDTMGKIPHPAAIDSVVNKIVNRANDKLTVLKAGKTKRDQVMAGIYNRASQAKENLNKKGDK